jgi:hypothetical protein
MRTELAEIVERGAAVLDEAAPGWPDAVNTTRLDVRTSPDCVLGQVFGSYHGARRTLGITDGAAYGFSLPGGFWDRPLPELWADLNRSWVECIERRRAARRLVSGAEELLAEARREPEAAWSP